MIYRLNIICCVLLFAVSLSSCQSIKTKPEIIPITPKKESQQEYLEKIYSTGAPQKLRETFNHYSYGMDFSKDEDNEAVSRVAKYMNSFSNKFIVIDSKEKQGPSCGKINYLTILIGSPSKNILAWGVYFYLDEEKRNKICRIENLGLNKQQKKEFDFLKKYKDYWL